MKNSITALDNIDIKIELGYLYINILYMRLAPFKRNTYIEYHAHSSYELHFIHKGYGKLYIGNECLDIEPGVLYLTGPGVYHKQIAAPEDPMFEYCINFEFVQKHALSEEYLPFEKDMLLVTNVLSGTNFWFGKDESNSILLFNFVLGEINNRQQGYYFCIKNYIKQIFFNVARCFLKEQQSFYEPPKKNINDHRRSIIDEYVIKFQKNPNLNELAAKVGLSVRQVNRVLLKYYGNTFKQLILSSKIQEAKNLLLLTNESIKTISEKSGFEDSAYFCRVFKKLTGVKPTEFRKMHC